MRTFDLVIFDCDGTLVDSLAGIAAAARLALADCGLDAQVDTAAVAGVVGLNLDQAMASLLPDHDPNLHARVVDRYRHHYQRLADARELDNPLFPGVRGVLNGLQAAGMTLAVATGKSRRGLERTLNDHNLHGFFQALKTADQAPSKPHPAMVLEILAETGHPPARALMVGDTDFDILMGRNAGVTTCAVTYGCHARERLAAARPDHWIDHMAELPGVLGLEVPGLL
ncbi:MAG: HAD-IA family hydrolase [Magnetococcales bacterium]|nr:HAD-IA family hydrolase [Magnetococcales bacterium]